MYLLFAGEKCYPNGGAEDYIAAFETLDEAKQAIIGLKVNAYAYSPELADINNPVEGKEPEWADIAILTLLDLKRVSTWDKYDGWKDVPVQPGWKRWHAYEEPS